MCNGSKLGNDCVQIKTHKSSGTFSFILYISAAHCPCLKALRGFLVCMRETGCVCLSSQSHYIKRR